MVLKLTPQQIEVTTYISLRQIIGINNGATLYQVINIVQLDMQIMPTYLFFVAFDPSFFPMTSLLKGTQHLNPRHLPTIFEVCTTNLPGDTHFSQGLISPEKSISSLNKGLHSK